VVQTVAEDGAAVPGAHDDRHVFMGTYAVRTGGLRRGEWVVDLPAAGVQTFTAEVLG
jgi:hypothetical protein